MAAGDTVVVKDVDFDTTDALDLAAATGVEVVYQTIDHSDAIDVYAYDGTAEAKVLSFASFGVEPVFLRVTETERYRIKPGSGAANNAYLRATGVQVK